MRSAAIGVPAGASRRDVCRPGGLTRGVVAAESQALRLLGLRRSRRTVVQSGDGHPRSRWRGDAGCRSSPAHTPWAMLFHRHSGPFSDEQTGLKRLVEVAAGAQSRCSRLPGVLMWRQVLW